MHRHEPECVSAVRFDGGMVEAGSAHHPQDQSPRRWKALKYQYAPVGGDRAHQAHGRQEQQHAVYAHFASHDDTADEQGGGTQAVGALIEGQDPGGLGLFRCVALCASADGCGPEDRLEDEEPNV